MGVPRWHFFACLYFLAVFWSMSLCFAGNVSYDSRSLIIGGQRKLLISASIHYPRSVPAMWPELVQTAKEGGVDVIETYVFWNIHQPTSPNEYHFEGRFDLVKFVKIVQQAGMYLILRIGPFVAAEWNFGGLPVWLHYIPGTVFRTDNTNFKFYMQQFMTYIVNLMKQEKLFAWQGGPIILAQGGPSTIGGVFHLCACGREFESAFLQNAGVRPPNNFLPQDPTKSELRHWVENEYGYYESDYGEGGKRYAQWAATMAVSLDTGIPWIMCQQFDAPDSVINTCNSFYCDQFKPIFPDKPKIWTENWPGWFQTFGEPNPHRPPEDIAFSVARFFQKGGSVQNYYMYHGGTNFGRTSGGPFITTSYDYDAPIDEYGLARFPKWGHLKELHQALKLCEHALLNGKPANFSLGPAQEADVYAESLGACAAFLANTDEEKDVSVVFRNVSYHLPAWSVSILPDCKHVVFNTAQVNSQTSVVKMIPEPLRPSSVSSEKGPQKLTWEVFMEKVGIWGEADFVKNLLVDHINTTQDATDYLWYTTSITIGEDEEFLKSKSHPVLIVESKGHALHAFVNQQFQGSASGNGTHSPFIFRSPISFKAGKNEVALLSMTVGLQNGGSFYEWVGAGLTSVKIEVFRNFTIDLSTLNWSYKIGLQGEKLGLFRPNDSNNVNWVKTVETPKNKPLTWYKAIVDAPTGTERVALDMLHMGKGLAWLNGEEIGRYWPRKSSVHDNCVSQCDYRGKFMPGKCRYNCGEPTQRWYHVPLSWFRPSGNILVIFEEVGGDPTKVVFSKRKVSNLCALIAERHLLPGSETLQGAEEKDTWRKASVNLKCPNNALISMVHFASYGTPTGSCGSYSKGDCHDPNSVAIVEKACLNKNECTIEVTNENFSNDLCPDATKKLAVEAFCS